MPFDALKTLHTSLLDTREGYELAARDAETPPLKELFQHMIGLRNADHEAIHGALLSLGERPDDSGSFMATIHKAAVGLRSAVAGIDESALSQFVSGEERILDQYRAAIEEAGSNGELATLLTRQQGALETEITKMKAMAS